VIRFPKGGRKCSVFSSFQNCCGVPLTSYPVPTRIYAPGIMRTRREAVHSSSPNDQTKNAYRCTLTPAFVFMAQCLIKQRRNLTFIFTLLPRAVKVQCFTKQKGCLEQVHCHYRDDEYFTVKSCLKNEARSSLPRYAVHTEVLRHLFKVIPCCYDGKMNRRKTLQVWMLPIF
jgi:hypothetical protein